MLRRVLVVVTVVTGLAAFGAAAGASVPAAPRRAATFDGRVRVVAASGNTVYVGGHFTHATGVDGRVVTRNRVAAVDVDPDQVPVRPCPPVRTSGVDGGGGVVTLFGGEQPGRGDIGPGRHGSAASWPATGIW